MSDTGRKGLGQQVQEKLTPDSNKSALDQAKEGITGTFDRAAGAMQPEGQKSYTQKAGDAVRSNADTAEKEGRGIIGTAKDTLGDAANSVSNALGGNSNSRK